MILKERLRYSVQVIDSLETGTILTSRDIRQTYPRGIRGQATGSCNLSLYNGGSRSSGIWNVVNCTWWGNSRGSWDRGKDVPTWPVKNKRIHRRAREETESSSVFLARKLICRSTRGNSHLAISRYGSIKLQFLWNLSFPFARFTLHGWVMAMERSRHSRQHQH